MINLKDIFNIPVDMKRKLLHDFAIKVKNYDLAKKVEDHSDEEINDIYNQILKRNGKLLFKK